MGLKGVFEGTLNVGMKIGKESRLIGADKCRSDTDGYLMSICLMIKI